MLTCVKIVDYKDRLMSFAFNCVHGEDEDEDVMIHAIKTTMIMAPGVFARQDVVPYILELLVHRHKSVRVVASHLLSDAMLMGMSPQQQSEHAMNIAAYMVHDDLDVRDAAHLAVLGLPQWLQELEEVQSMATQCLAMDASEPSL